MKIYNDIENRMSLNYERVLEDLEQILSFVKEFCTDKFFLDLVGESYAEKLRCWDLSIRKRIEEPLNIVILGDFKRGKSTFINALLGKKVVPTNVTPETMTINKLSYGDHSSYEAVLKNGKKLKLIGEELQRVELENLLKQINTEIEYVEIKEKADILKGICLVDTPGLGDVLNYYDDQVKDYLINADAIIYIVSARAPISLTEQTFISASILPQNFSKISVLINMVDSLENQLDIERVEGRTQDKLKNIIPNAEIFSISALDEYCRKLNLDRPEPELAGFLENQFNKFLQSLNENILFQRDIIKTMRGLVLGNLFLKDIMNRIALISNLLKEDIYKLSSVEDKYKEEYEKLTINVEKMKNNLVLDIDEMKVEGRSWIYEFMSALKREILSIKDKTSTELLEKYFQFFMMDKIKEAMTVCTLEHEKQIKDKIEAAVRGFSTELLSDTKGNVDYQIAEYITDISWTKIDSAMFATSIGIEALGQSIPGINGLVILGKAIAGALRRRQLEGKKADYLQPILQEFDNLTEQVQCQMDIIYEEMKTHGIDYLHRVNQEQIEISLTAINQAEEVLNNTNIEREKITAYLDNINIKLKELRASLDKYQI